MENNRIYFKDNPWPEGHRVVEFVWSAKEVDGEIWFDLHLKSDDYYAERDIEDDEDEDYPSSWDAPIVWGNYHCCTLSSNYWGDEGFKACAKDTFSPNHIDGLTFNIDPDPDSLEDFDDLAFGIYLLGHDAVAQHTIKFVKNKNADTFTIYWSGKIAKAYVGDYEFKHDFSVVMTDVKFPELETSA